MQNPDTDTTNSPEVSLDTWGVIELFGHCRIAGKLTNVSIAGCGFIRVQVPAHGNVPAYTRDIAPKAVYALNPCDEAAARAALGSCNDSPVVQMIYSEIYTKVRDEMTTRTAATATALPPGRRHDDDDYTDNDEPDQDDALHL